MRWWGISRTWCERPEGTVPLFEVDGIADSIVATAPRGEQDYLRPDDVNRILGAYGFPVCRAELTPLGADIAEAAERVGYPVALKVFGGSIIHKSDMGGVALGLKDAKALEGARCVSGWACSFGERVVLIVEVIDPARGLPGAVHRVTCEGLEGIPAGLEDLLKKAELEGVKVRAEARAPAPPTAKELPDVLTRIPEDDLLETYPNDAYRKLLEKRTFERRWATPAEYEQATQWLIAAKDHAARLRSDRRYREEWKVRTNMRMDPIMSEVPLVVASRPPWLVFVEYGVARESEEAARKEAERAAGMLEQLSDEMARRLGLPPIADCPFESERVLKMIVFRSGKSFLEHHRRIAKPLPPGTLSIYESKQEGGKTYLDPKRTPAEWAKALFHPAACQLLHVWVKASMELERMKPGSPEGEELGWGDRGVHGQLVFFREGLVRMFCAVDVGGNISDGSAPAGEFDFSTQQ